MIDIPPFTSPQVWATTLAWPALVTHDDRLKNRTKRMIAVLEGYHGDTARKTPEAGSSHTLPDPPAQSQAYTLLVDAYTGNATLLFLHAKD